SLQHLFTKDVYGQFSLFFRDIYGLLTVRPERDAAGNQISVWTNGDYASARGFELSLTRGFAHHFSTDVSYTYSIATGVASDPASPGEQLPDGRPPRPADLRARAALGSAPHAVDAGRDPLPAVGHAHAVGVRLGPAVHARIPERPTPRSAPRQLAAPAVQLAT